ncbi:MAG TPA: CopG family transcriptional regulator [Candidatus Kaiserbacteria bacterium]|nr:CopG family transcriptional regulator [Candidatus Kaiserbacteria bacterium]
MSTISVPLTKEREAKLDNLVKDGVAPNRAAVMRKALDKLAEDEAIEAVFRAEREVTEGKILRGDIRKVLLDFEQ